MSDTPRVDAICKKRNCAYWGIPRSDAEEIERDLNVAIAERDALRANFQEYRDRAEQAEQKNAELAAQLATITKTLRDLFDQVDSLQWYEFSKDIPIQESEDNWRDALYYTRKCLANLPAEAEKVRKVVEAAKYHCAMESACNGGCDCKICEAVRALNPEPPK